VLKPLLHSDNFIFTSNTICILGWLSIGFCFCPLSPVSSSVHLNGSHELILTLPEALPEKYPAYIVCIYVIKSWCGIRYKIKMSYRNLRRTVQAGASLDFVDEEELSDLWNVAGNKPTFSVSPANQLRVHNRGNDILRRRCIFFCYLKNKCFSAVNGSPPTYKKNSCRILFLRTQPDTDVRQGSSVLSLVKRNTGKGHMQIYEK